MEIVPYPAVNGILLDAQGRVLLTKRSQKIRAPGQWCLPGGHVDGGEGWVAALKRELKEEIGIEVVRQCLVGIYSDPSLTVTEEPLYGKTHRGQFLVASFLIQSFTGEIQPNFEVDTWEWFEVKSLPKPLIRSHPIRIEDAVNFSGNVFVR